MPLLYAIKRVFRSWRLFLAILIGITLASAFFAGIDIKTSVTAKQALEQQLKNIYVDMQASVSNLNTTETLAVRDKALEVEGVVDAEILCKSIGFIEVCGKNVSEDYVSLVAIQNDSRVYDGWLNKPQEEIGENETYVLSDTLLADEAEVNDLILVNFSSRYGERTFMTLNLTVKGVANLTDEAYAIASGYQQWITPFTPTVEPPRGGVGFLLISFEKTMKKILEVMEREGLSWLAERNLLIYLNRDALINPWDVGTSINNVVVIKNSVETKIATDLGKNLSIQNNLETPLFIFQITSIILRFAFTIVSLPIFFMAWYMGTTVSDVSFNLRRREVGLLLTKGFSRGQILRIFLIETLLIGFVGGLVGVFLGFLLNPLFTQFSSEAYFNLNLISPFTVAFTVAFGVIMALLSTFNSAKRASQLPTVDALREYLPTEAEKPFKRRWPLVALILGTYKVGVFISGVNMNMMLSRIMFASGNFILILLIGIFMFVDAILNYIGPLLFFWGFTKMFIQGSLEFQKLTVRAAKFLGELGVLATKNVRRNPARSAAVAFLIALIVGYSVQVNGQLASEHDYAVRQVYYSVGADIAIDVANVSAAPEVLEAVMANVSEYVQDAAIEYSFSASLVPSGTWVTVKAVEPSSWMKAAYYEGEWFSGTDAATAFNILALGNYTIILERSIADSANIKVGENISLSFGAMTKKLQVAGFFGPQATESQQIFSRYWSYVSHEFYNEISSYVSASAKILLKLKRGADGKTVAKLVRNIDSVSYVESFAEEWEKFQTNIISMGVLDVQRLGIVFAVLAASVGTALVSVVSMREREREATIMSVRGLSYKQLVMMFLTENLALVTFSVLLGVFVGFAVVYGNISSSNAMISDLIRRRLVFPLDSTLMLVFCLTLIFAATVLPILIMSRKYVTKLERMVRLR
ncbi:MAG: FtsX-like permease family protein [Candidatus Bathycorpusculaceae bacterium]